MIGVALAAVAFAASTPALPVRVARREALRAATRSARAFHPRPRVSVGFTGCKRRSRTTVDCLVTFTFPPPQDGRCTRTWRVRYRSATDRRLRTRPLGDPSC